MNFLVNNHDMLFTSFNIIDGNGGISDLKILDVSFSWIVSINIDDSVMSFNYERIPTYNTGVSVVIKLWIVLAQWPQTGELDINIPQLYRQGRKVAV